MDLYSGQPYWLAKNSFYDYFNPLTSNLNTDVVIIGSGITGALVAHELCKAGIECCIIDKRSISTGSTIASTALLQYEIDIPLSKMVDIVGKQQAVKAYQASLKSIEDLEKVCKEINYNPGFKRVSSVYYASSLKDLGMLRKEYRIREENGLPVTYYNKKELFKEYGFKAPGALGNSVSAQIDTYAAATHIIDYNIKKNNLKVYSHTEIVKYKEVEKGYRLTTYNDQHVHCKYVIIATGFEAGEFLPKKVMNLTSTYAIISEPLEKKHLLFGSNLIWETKHPYIYIRTTEENRIIIGGEDEEFKDPVKRDALLRKKVEKLEKKFKKLFPDIPFVTSMAWCGTFSSTNDGLPYIGTWPGKDRMFYALGYGGNGITFSMIAAQVIKNKLTGVEDEREKIFNFNRARI